MDHIDEYVDERQKAWCIHCGRPLVSSKTNRDHIPTKTILHPPYPANLPVIKICEPCNESFSLDEQYFVAFLGAVTSGSTEPNSQINPNANRILAENARLRERIERSKTHYKARDGSPRIVWAPELDRIKNVIIKNARGHVLFEAGEPKLENPDDVWIAPITSLSRSERDEFETSEPHSLLPEVGSRLMSRLLGGQDLECGWVVVQRGTYRYRIVQDNRCLVRSVIYEYLATEVSWLDN